MLGALVITGEYGTGMIRSTFAAVPKRLPALLAKAVVFGVSTFVISLVTLAGSALIAAPLLNAKGMNLDFGDGRVSLAVLGAAGFMTLVGLMALFLSTIIRNSAGGISAAIGLPFVAPIIIQIFVSITRSPWAQNILEFLPSTAGQRMSTYAIGPLPQIKDVVILDAGLGLLVLAAWVSLFGIIAGVLLKRRDA